MNTNLVWTDESVEHRKLLTLTQDVKHPLSLSL